ncbi:MAG: hypothetical protein R3Y67_00295 [Eubacteriales bacterium]
MTRLKSQHKEIIIFGIVTLLTTILFFLLVKDWGIQYAVDSQSYVELGAMHGVKPIYPLFLFVHKLLFGEEAYLQAAVISQGLLSVGCSLGLVFYLKKLFGLHYIEVYICYCLSLLVYMIEWPNFISSQYILTEAITYPLFYLYFITVLQVIYKGGWKSIVLCGVMSFLLAMTRSQLLLVMGITSVAFTIALARNQLISKRVTVKNLLLVIVKGVVVIPLTLYLGIQSVNYGMTVYLSAYATIESISTQATANDSVTNMGVEDQEALEAAVQTVEVVNVTYSDNQSSHALWQRLSYTIDEEDVALFDDPHFQEIFSQLYEAIDEAQQRYPYRPKNLWTWEHIANSTNQNASITDEITDAYRIAHAEDPTFQEDSISIKDKLSSQLLREHWLDYLYYTLCLFPQSFVCTVFFQIESIYLLCHIITLFLYISAIVMSILCVKNKKLDTKVGIYMFTVLVASCCFIVATNLVFYGIQRYLYYIFGTFYIGYFLLLCQMYRGYLQAWWKTHRKSNCK